MQISHNVSLEQYNTFGIAAEAAVFLHIESRQDILLALEQFGHPELIVGGGSNILIIKPIIEGPVRKFDNSQIETNDGSSGDKVLITVGAGMVRDELVKYTVEQGYWGIENLVAIPGTVGAAPVQNIGAYGVELQDVFVSCRAYDFETGEFVQFSKDQCDFGYRHSIFKDHPGRYIITDITLQLSKTPTPVLSYTGLQDLVGHENITSKDIADRVENIRWQKLPHPEHLGNSGSFFQNPIVEKGLVERLLEQYTTMPHYAIGITGTHKKLSAAWLIDQSGLKGYRQGNVGTYEKQPLVIVNHGGATGQEIYDFSEFIIDTVEKKFGVKLVREVNVVN